MGRGAEAEQSRLFPAPLSEPTTPVEFGEYDQLGFLLKVNSFCRCCELLVPLHLPQKMALKPSDSLHPLGDGNGSLLSPDNSPPPSYPESQNGGGRDRLPQASSSGF